MLNSYAVFTMFEEKIVSEREKSQSNQENLPYILISYCYTDRQKVLPLIRYLDDTNGGSFHIKYDAIIKLPMEMDWEKRREIEEAHAVLIFVSREFKSSNYFDRFMNYTKLRNKTVIIAYLECITIPKALRLPEKSYHYMRYDMHYDDMKVFSDELSNLAELEECYEQASKIHFQFELVNQYRSLISLQSDFFLSVKRKDDTEYEQFENYTDFHRKGGYSQKKKSPEKFDEWAEDQSFSKAERCLRKAALDGDAASMLTLALLLSEGREGMKINKEEAFYWFKKAAAEGNTSAWYYLGFCYEHGSGTTQNLAEALNCYRIGAAKNDFRSRQAYNALRRSK